VTSPEERYSFIKTNRIGALKKNRLQRVLLDRFLPRLPPGAVVAEVGPGRGEFARACSARRLEYVGIEPSAALAEALRAEGFRIVEETAPPLPLESGTVDLVHSNDFVEHLQDFRAVMEFFAEAFRVLKPGGFLSVVGPNYETIPALYFKYEYQHSFIVTRHRLISMLEDSGFVPETSRSFLFTLSPALNWLDRILAHTVLYLLVSAPFQSLLRGLSGDAFQFRFNKNLFDHTAALGRKPLAAEG
jgi:SAM-dependent methyltransferase